MGTLTINYLYELINTVQYSELSNANFHFLIRLDGKFSFNLKFMSRDFNFSLIVSLKLFKLRRHFKDVLKNLFK